MSDASTEETAESDAPSDSTRQIASYPSRLLRPVPAFVFSVPEGWVVEEAPDSLALVRTPVEIDDFWVNAVISHDRVLASMTLEDAAKGTWARVKAAIPDSEPEMQRVVRFDNKIAYLRGIELKAPESGRDLAQLHAIFFAPTDGDYPTADLFQIACTAATETMERVTGGFLEIIGSLRFT